LLRDSGTSSRSGVLVPALNARVLHLERSPHSPLRDAQRTPVQEVMSGQVHLVRPETSVQTVLEVLQESGQSCVPVVDSGDRLLGVVSLEDVKSEEADFSDRTDTRPDIQIPSGLMGNSRFVPKTAGAVMRRAVTITDSAPVALAAETLCLQRLQGMPVVNLSWQVSGFLSLADIVAWVAGVS
jgi:CBS domain-containing protein